MISTPAYATHGVGQRLKAHEILRREPGAHDLLLEILYCGICHTDIHQVRNEWGGSVYPMVPGHEIVGRVTGKGRQVRRYKIGDIVGVGCFSDSCRRCPSCRKGDEQYCEGHMVWTYNGTEKDGKTRTFGGYSKSIVVDENYALRIPSSIPLEKAAPLLCAGITMYSPLKHFGVRRGHQVGVIGMGGLGHMAVKIAVSMGARVTVFSHSMKKKSDALKFGAAHFVWTKDPKEIGKFAGKLDFLFDTVSANHDLGTYLGLLRQDGTMVIVGVPEKPLAVSAFSVIGRRRRLAGSMIGGIRETQEMLDYCAKKKITPEVEVIPIQKVNEAYERMLKGEVRYRYVIDLKSL